MAASPAALASSTPHAFSTGKGICVRRCTPMDDSMIIRLRCAPAEGEGAGAGAGAGEGEGEGEGEGAGSGWRVAMANLAKDNIDEFLNTGKCKNKVN